MSPLNTSDLHQIFKSLDQNGDGLLSLDELNWLLERTGVHAGLDELASLVGDSGLDFNEFSLFYESILKRENHNLDRVEKWDDDEERDLYRAFEVFDLDGDGLISPQELQSVLRRLGMWDNNGGVIDCDKIISKFDVNRDGFVDFEEFKRMMLAKSWILYFTGLGLLLANKR
ncbi:hypothetical protein Cgig2_004794 [Carnegiea gigantea]|uniref:EF-hand domain-containing protein n=1 Tax=Carnegiea gigantea TaxID=171969 RepID=A0A9Q1KVL6_9CARY|nr:hypothetical protein Cgig2_004794 [Carnegiea gigantea]